MIETIPSASFVPKSVGSQGGTALVINATISSAHSIQEADDTDTMAWAQLSVPSFARDWDSVEDSVYDDADLP